MQILKYLKQFMKSSFVYRFELKKINKKYNVELKGKYKNNAEYISKVTKIYSNL